MILKEMSIYFVSGHVDLIFYVKELFKWWLLPDMDAVYQNIFKDNFIDSII